MGFYSPRVVLNDARRFGLAVLPVDVNRSEEGFCVEALPADRGSAHPGGDPEHPGGDPAGPSDPEALGIRVALKYVKNMSTTAMHRIVAERGDVPRDILGRPVGRAVLADRAPRPDDAAQGGRAAEDGSRAVALGDTASGSRAVGDSRAAAHALATDGAAVGGAAAASRPAASVSHPDLPPRPYTSLSDFVERTRTSVEISENLVRVGAFDTLGTRREELLAQLPILYAGMGRRASGGGRGARPTGRPTHGAANGGSTCSAANGGSRHADRQSDEAEGAAGEALRLVADELPSLSFLPSWSLEDRVRAELNILGLNVSAHPLAFLRGQISALKVTPCAKLPSVPHGRRVRLAGVLERAQMPWIRSGHRTLFLTLEDETELAQVVVFNDTYLKYGRILKDALYFYVEGVLQNDEEHGLAVVAQRIFNLLEVVKGGGAGDAAAAARGSRKSVDPRRKPAGQQAGYNQTPLGSGPENRYPFTGPAPEDTRAGSAQRRLDLPEIQPRTRPGRTG